MNKLIQDQQILIKKKLSAINQNNQKLQKENNALKTDIIAYSILILHFNKIIQNYWRRIRH